MPWPFPRPRPYYEIYVPLLHDGESNHDMFATMKILIMLSPLNILNTILFPTEEPSHDQTLHQDCPLNHSYLCTNTAHLNK